MSDYNTDLFNRLMNYFISKGYSTEQSVYYMWNVLSFHSPNNVAILSHRYHGSLSHDITLFKLDHERIYRQLYNFSMCTVLVALQAINYQGKINIGLRDEDDKLWFNIEFNESVVFDSSKPNECTFPENSYFHALMMFGTTEMLSNYIDKLNEFPKKIKVMKNTAKSNIFGIADFENKALVMRFINENNNMEDIKL